MCMSMFSYWVSNVVLFPSLVSCPINNLRKVCHPHSVRDVMTWHIWMTLWVAGIDCVKVFIWFMSYSLSNFLMLLVDTVLLLSLIFGEDQRTHSIEHTLFFFQVRVSGSLCWPFPVCLRMASNFCFSTSGMLRLQLCNTTPSLFGAEYPTQAFVHARPAPTIEAIATAQNNSHD